MDFRSETLKSLEFAVGAFTKDLEALPESAFTQSFGGKSRTVADLVFEVAVVNDMFISVLKGTGEMQVPDSGWITAPADLTTKQAVIDRFRESAKALLEAGHGFSEAEFGEMIQTPQGERSRNNMLGFMATHIMYHGGQINFIQTMLGDDDFHWM